jgi:putative hydrolase
MDTDAHAPGQLDRLDGGCVRAQPFGVGQDRLINTRSPAAVRVLTACWDSQLTASFP